MFLTLATSGQVCPPNNVSTNPDSPRAVITRPDMANTFRWQNLSYRANLPANPSPSYQHPNGSIRSPWDQPNNAKVDRFRNNPDYKWEDGWEIITKYNGYDNQDNLISPPQFEHPYVVLYNKYSGLMRIFFSFSKAPTQALFNGAKFEIKFVGTQSNQYAPSLLDLIVESPVPLSKGGAKNAFGEAMMDYDNIDLDWFFADFPMQYDPCTCLYSSKVQIKPLLISCNDLELQGTITGTLEPIKQNRVQDSKTKFSYGQAISGYKKINNTYKDLASIVNDINIKKDKVFANDEAKKSVIANAINALNLNLGSGAKDALKTLPWLGAALGFMDFFTGLGKKPGPQPVEVSPMSIDMTASLKGTLCGQGSFGSIIFHTPGSSGIPATEKAQYPLYNEALGLFNIIDTPQVIRKATVIGFVSNGGGPCQPGTPGCTPYYKLEYRLKNSVKYALNPAANLQIKEVQGSFIVETNDSLQISGTGFNTWSALGKNSLNNKWLHSTRLFGIDTLSDYIFNFVNSPAGPGPGVRGPVDKGYLQIVIRFTKIGDTTGILYSARYPIQVINHSTANSSTDIGTVTNGATTYPNYFTPLTTQEISDFCNGPKYKNRDRQYSRVADQWQIGVDDSQIENIDLNVYPNPASNNITVEFLNPKLQNVNIKIINSIGQELKRLSSGSMPAGIIQRNYDVSDLRNGLVYLIIEINEQKASRKILINK